MKKPLGPEENRLELEGDWDLSRREELDFLFSALRSDEPAVIDMSRATYIDSTVLHQLASVRQRFNGHQITVVANGPVSRLLRMVAFDKMFRVVDKV
ncbi:MAG TPA: STAS domain-containing protein [Candidatus Binatia bacterium]|nr:STAS domain-containing protein [Candidatus Binatia bacterium]